MHTWRMVIRAILLMMIICRMTVLDEQESWSLLQKRGLHRGFRFRLVGSITTVRTLTA